MFLLGILICPQSGDHPLEDVVKVAIIPRKIFISLAT